MQTRHPQAFIELRHAWRFTDDLIKVMPKWLFAEVPIQARDYLPGESTRDS